MYRKLRLPLRLSELHFPGRHQLSLEAPHHLIELSLHHDLNVKLCSPHDFHPHLDHLPLQVLYQYWVYESIFWCIQDGMASNIVCNSTKHFFDKLDFSKWCTLEIQVKEIQQMFCISQLSCEIGSRSPKSCIWLRLCLLYLACSLCLSERI